MAYNEELAQRIRQQMTQFGENVIEKKMFGGLTFMYKNKMSVGIVGDQLMTRVVSEKYQQALEKDHVKEMDFTGKSLKDFVYVDQAGCKTEQQLAEWIELGVEHAERNS